MIPLTISGACCWPPGYLKQTVSIRDTFVRKPTKENFFHGILLAITGFKDGWFLKSNRDLWTKYPEGVATLPEKQQDSGQPSRLNGWTRRPIPQSA